MSGNQKTITTGSWTSGSTPALQVATRGQTPPSRPFDFLPVTSVNGLARRP